MAASEPTPKPYRVFRFGPFELSEAEGELRKNGVRIKLQEQPFRMLVELLASAGKVVSREELQQRLWSSDTFVDFDVGLNTAIRKLRQALDDNADAPRYIETLARRGYRFITPVVVSAASGPASVVAQQAHIEPETVRTPQAGESAAIGVREAEAVIAAAPTSVEGSRQSHGTWKWIAIAAIAVAVIVGFAAWWLRPPVDPVVETIAQLTDDGRPKGVLDSLQSDGLRLYFNEGRRGGLEIAQVSAPGGPVATIPTPLLDAQPVGIAPDGSYLLVLQGGAAPPAKPVWKVPLPTGDPVRLGNLKAQDGSVTPDGRILLSDMGDLYIVEGDGTNLRKIISGVYGFVGNPSMSPDGRQIVFSRYNPAGGGVELQLANSDGSNIHLLAKNEEAGFCCARWTPDSRYIVFETRVKVRQDLWYMPVRRGWLQRRVEPRKLTSGPLSFHAPVPSRDGKTVFAVGTKERGELVRYDVKSKQFVSYLGGISADNESFSRDGQWVAYRSFPDHTLWRSRVDGTDRLQLTSTPVDENVSFSPDGKRVMYGQGRNIYAIEIDGGQPQAIVSDDKSGGADLSPDGKLVAFFTSSEDYKRKLNILDLASGKRSALPGQETFWGIRWITNDKLVGLRLDSTFEVFDLKTQTWTEWALESKPQAITRWGVSPGQQCLYYATAGADPALMRVRLGENRAETITSLKDFIFAMFVQINGADEWISVAPDGSPLLTRDKGSQEVYGLTVRWP